MESDCWDALTPSAVMGTESPSSRSGKGAGGNIDSGADEEKRRRKDCVGRVGRRAAAVELGMGGSGSERKAQLVRRGCPDTGAFKIPVISCYA